MQPVPARRAHNDVGRIIVGNGSFAGAAGEVSRFARRLTTDAKHAIALAKRLAVIIA